MGWRWYRYYHPRTQITPPDHPATSQKIKDFIKKLDSLDGWEPVPCPSPLLSSLAYVYTIDQDADTLTISTWGNTLTPTATIVNLTSALEATCLPLEDFVPVSTVLSDDGACVDKTSTEISITGVLEIDFGKPTPMNELQEQFLTDFVFLWRFYIDDPQSWYYGSPAFRLLCMAFLRLASWDFEVSDSDDYNNQLPIHFASVPRWSYPKEDVFWFHGFLVVLNPNLDSESTKSEAVSKSQYFLGKTRLHDPVRLILISPKHVAFVELDNGDILATSCLPLLTNASASGCASGLRSLTRVLTSECWKNTHRNRERWRFHLPPEILQAIMDHVSPRDAVAFAQASFDAERNHHYFVFTISENVPEAVPRILEDSLSTFHYLPLRDFLETVSGCLDKATLPEDSQSNSSQQDSGTDHESENMEWEDTSESGLNPGESVINVHECIRADLRKARQAGFRVGYLGDLDSSVILCASRRISKLGISHEAMEAWGVRPSQYFVLLIRYPHGYRRFLDVVHNQGGAVLIQLYAGVCEKYKPSLYSALHVFETGAAPVSHDANRVETEPVLNSIFIGKSLQALLNGRFTDIVKYRLENGFSWTGAELYLNDGQGKLLDAFERSHSKYFEPESWRVPPPDFLKDDHLAKAEQPSDISLLLIAMQFTLRRFVKCTEFCLNCYCKIDAGFEALKPFVCSKGLCLYQYMSLGMGPSLEWEISSQPYVADLLISFAYTRVAGGKLEDFPTGFPLKVPHPERAIASEKTYKGHLTYDKKRGPSLRMNSSYNIKEGDWIVIMLDSTSVIDTLQMCNKSELHARVTDTSDRPNISLSDPIHCDHKSLDPQLQIEPHTGQVDFVVYDTDFASLPQSQRPRVLLGLLNTLPTVSEMKSYIDQKQGGHLRPLSQWQDRIHLSALYVLQWIVGSNRSVILYDDNPQNQVLGMHQYMQFRFAQGAPDKEQRFVASVNKTASRLKLKYPTLFAWHGSPLLNWHSIVREGLHYRDIVNGRNFGNGIYMAPNFNTSITYCRNSVRYIAPSSSQWPNSELKCTMAISLNEVVNAPGEFTSQEPHYVVQHLDWVQPRYLFIECALSAMNREGKPKLETLSQVYSQDPSRVVFGATGALTIPISATNSHRSRDSPQSQHNVTSILNKGKRKISSILKIDRHDDNSDTDSISTLSEDRLVLLSDDEANVGSSGRRNSHSSSRLSLTDFQPDSLNTSSIKLLGEPTYATPRATRTLQKVLRQALETQNNQPLHELGWYINANLIDNVYQWIVELHSFDKELQIAKDLEKAGLTSIVMEMRFPSEFPLAPPFLRIIRPRFVRFTEGGGGHITAGGAMCMELLTTTGWLPAFSIESVLLQVRMAITNEVPRPARLDLGPRSRDYAIGEAISEYKRVCVAHGWTVPKDLDQIRW
ncbi:hypothetical protein BJX76DRAFT_359242 [Aspergillus varians]